MLRRIMHSDVRTLVLKNTPTVIHSTHVHMEFIMSTMVPW